MRIETERLLLRKPILKDFDEYWFMKNDESATKYTGGVTPYSYNERFEMFRKEWVDTDQNTELSITIKASDEYIGYCGFINDNELLYGLKRSAWGHGYGHEAAKAALHHGFSVLKLPFIVSTVNPENIASEKILQNLGLAFDSTYKESGVLLNKYILTCQDYLAKQQDKQSP